MSNRVLLKKSSVSAKIPLSGDLEYGELALNYIDGKLYFKTAINTIEYFGSTSNVAMAVMAQRHQEYTATASQTTFIIINGYNVGTVQVFANGIALASSDYSATNGYNVVLNDARVINDNIIIWYANAAGGISLPNQIGNSGKYLTTDGTSTYWIDGVGLSLPNQTGNSGKYLTTNGTNAYWSDGGGGGVTLIEMQDYINSLFNNLINADGGSSSIESGSITIDSGDAASEIFPLTLDGGFGGNIEQVYINGGNPSTVYFDEILDGGSPSSSSFSTIIDGGNIEQANGGNPSTVYFDVILDGGSPSSSSFSTIIDGGTP